jgi:hypothetical protein
MIVLSRIRHRQREEGLAEEITEQVEERMHGEPSVREAREQFGHRRTTGETAGTGGTRVEVRTPDNGSG